MSNSITSITRTLARILSCVVVLAQCLPAATRTTTAHAVTSRQDFRQLPLRRNKPALTGVTAAQVIGKIAFVSDRDGNDEIYLMNADGSNQTRLAADPGIDLSPKWSPDGRILFTSSRDGQEDIYVMDDNGGNVTRLTKMRAGQAAWSPDGRKVAFVGNSLERIAGHFQFQIFVGDADGNNVRMLTTSPDSTFGPCWSSNGRAIAFNIDKLGVMANIFQIDLDGGNLRRLTVGPKIDGRPAFSPDGSKLAFQSNRDGDYEIYVMNLH